MNFIFRFLFSILLLSLIFIFSGCSTVKHTGRVQVMWIEEGQEQDLGEKAWDAVKQKEKKSNEQRLNDAVQRVGKNIASAAMLSDHEWEFTVFDSNTLNAFSLPNGKVGINQAFFKYIKNDAELASVLSSAIAHSIARHGGERITDLMVNANGGNDNIYNPASYSDSLLLRVFGISSEEGEVIPYNQVQEEEADYIGLSLLSQAGYSPEAALEFWEKLSKISKENSSEEYFITHPLPDSRLSKMREKIQNYKDLYFNAVTKHGLGENYSFGICTSALIEEPSADTPSTPSEPSVTAAQAPPDKLLETAQRALQANNFELFKKTLAAAEFNALENPNSPDAWMLYGKILSMVNNSQESNIIMEGIFLKVLELDPKNSEARRYLADTLFQQDLFYSAIKELEKVIDSGAYTDPKTVALLNMAYIRDEQFQRGLNYLKALAEKYPQKDYIRLYLAILAHHTGDRHLAISELRKVVFRPESSKISKIMAGRLMFMNQPRR